MVFYSIYRLSSTKDGSEDVPKSSPKLPHIIHGFFAPPKSTGWLGSRVVSVLDSGAEGPRFKSQSRRCLVTVLGKLFTPVVPLFTRQQNW